MHMYDCRVGKYLSKLQIIKLLFYYVEMYEKCIRTWFEFSKTSLHRVSLPAKPTSRPWREAKEQLLMPCYKNWWVQRCRQLRCVGLWHCSRWGKRHCLPANALKRADIRVVTTAQSLFLCRSLVSLSPNHWGIFHILLLCKVSQEHFSAINSRVEMLGVCFMFL